MSSVRAHFDGKKIQLDEPIELPKGAKLIVTVVEEATEKKANRGLTRVLEKAHPWGPEVLSENHHRYFSRR